MLFRCSKWKARHKAVFALCAAKAEPSTKRRSGEERNGHLEWMWLGSFVLRFGKGIERDAREHGQPRPAARLKGGLSCRNVFPPKSVFNLPYCARKGEG